MGINGLWDIIGEGSVESIAALAAKHFERTGRPFRIAIDEAGWRFHNLDDHKITKIREQEPRANPKEKAILHRVISLLQLHVELLFVFDGPRRPRKRGRPSGGVKYDRIALLTKTLDALKVPHHRAPGEAEAECAKLQQEGIVDAVWSEDGDTLMFGCEYLLRTYRDRDRSEAKSKTHVRVHHAKEIYWRTGLDRQGLILFAIICGGDYSKGIHRCGPQNALKAAQQGFGVQLCHALSSLEMDTWRSQLQDFFSTHARGNPVVLFDFPSKVALKNYRNPVISSSVELHDFGDKPSHQWGREIDEEKLSELAAEKFNISGSLYSRHIDPIYFVRSLAQSRPDNPESNCRWCIRRVKSRGKGDPTLAEKVTTKVKIRPREAQIVNESDDGSLIECEILNILLQRGLQHNIVEEITGPRKQGRKRKANEIEERTDGEEDSVHAADTIHSNSADMAQTSSGRANRHSMAGTGSGHSTQTSSKQKKTSAPGAARGRSRPEEKRDNITAALLEGAPTTKYSLTHKPTTSTSKRAPKKHRTSKSPTQRIEPVAYTSPSHDSHHDKREPVLTAHHPVSQQNARPQHPAPVMLYSDDDDDLPDMDTLIRPPMKPRVAPQHRVYASISSQEQPVDESTAAATCAPTHVGASLNSSQAAHLPADQQRSVHDIDEWNDAQLQLALSASLDETQSVFPLNGTSSNANRGFEIPPKAIPIKPQAELLLESRSSNRYNSKAILGATEVIDLCED